MADGTTIIAGIPIPSTSPVFVSIVGFHILAGIACIITGAVAMVSAKGRGRHTNFGTIYSWCLAIVAASAAALSLVHWAQDYHLFILGALSFASAFLGRRALRRRWHHWPRLHVIGMGTSYILLVTAFYVDNGKNLPLWKELPQIAFWLLPGAIGVPIIAYVLWRHPLVRALLRLEKSN